MNLKKLKRFTAIALVTTLSFTSVVKYNGFKNPVKAMAAEAQNPLETIWTTLNGVEGSVSFDETNALSLVGTGEAAKFGKGGGIDGILTEYVPVKGDVEVVAKMDLTGLTVKQNGFAGIIARASADGEGTNKTQSVSIYADMVNGDGNQIRYGRNIYNAETGNTDTGASQINSNVQVGTSDYAWLKLLIKQNGDGTSTMTYYVSADPEFSDNKFKSETKAIVPTMVGFYATDGVNVKFSDISIKTNYTSEEGEVKKIVYSSAYGELQPEWSKSLTYDNDFEFLALPFGNELLVTSTRGANKGDIRSAKSVDYLLFPKMSENCTVSADVIVNSINNGTDKQGVAVGIIAPDDVTSSWLQFNKNNASQHNFNSGSGTNGGNPKASGLVFDGKTLYNISYQRTADETGAAGIAYLVHKDASGAIINGGYDNPVTLANVSADLEAGKEVRYGMAFSAAEVIISNLKLVNEDGYVIYDMNDYYKVEGQAAVLGEITKAEVNEDRSAIDVEWSIAEEGTGNVSYVVYVSKNGGDYEFAGNSKVASFAYVPDGDGTYKFKVESKSGDSVSEPIESGEVDYVTPLEQPVVTVSGEHCVATLNFDAVPDATSYEIARNGSVIEVIEDNGEASYTYTDATVTAEEPYYYQVTAVNNINSSNPSEAMLVLPTNGHPNQDDINAKMFYALTSGFDAFDIVDKPNDTVFESEIAITVVPKYSGVLMCGDFESLVEAGQEVLVPITLNKGRNAIGLTLTTADKDLYIKQLNFVCNPKIDVVVDSAYAGDDGALVGFNGVDYPTYSTVSAAVASIGLDNEEAKVVFIKNGDYNERVVVTAPYVELLGEDAMGTRIYKSVALADKSASGMWDRNVVYVDSTAEYFSAENLTIENTFPYTNGSDQQADALAIVADQTVCTNIRLIGYQDTLLTDSRVKDTVNGDYLPTHQAFISCYITGNIDFIYGSGSTVFYACEIVGRYTEYKADGCFVAPRTYLNTPYGMSFLACSFKTEEGIGANAYRLARPWGKDASALFGYCDFPGTLRTPAYDDMSGNSYKNARFFEYQSTGAGFAVDNDRSQLTSDEFFALADLMGQDNSMLMTDAYDEMYMTSTFAVELEVNGDVPEMEGYISEDMLVCSDETAEYKAANPFFDSVLRVVVSEIPELSVEDAAALAEYAEEYDFAKMFDISLFYSVDGQDEEQIKELSSPLETYVSLEGVYEEGKIVALLGVHDGVAFIKEVEVDSTGELALGKVDLDHFSTYVLAVKKVAEITEPTQEPTTDTEPVATGDSANAMLYMMLAMGASAVLLVSRKKKEN